MSKGLEQKTKQLVDELKKICADHGLGNDGNEYKIITEVFLYKFLNDKFFYEVKRLHKKYATVDKLDEVLANLTVAEFEEITFDLPANTARLKKEQFLSNLFNSQNKPEFAKYVDDTMKAVANDNAAIFSVGTAGGEKVRLFSGISNYITEEGKRDGFCRSIINKLFECNFGDIFKEKYDFFAVIFEYLIKDYNKDGGGKYAEYYTPHAVAKIMSEILVHGNVVNAQCYDPSAGTGSLLMSLAHKIGEDRCSIYSQDISQKSSALLRMNLILNNLSHSLPNVVQGNTMTEPYHLSKGIGFDYIVSNPPFKLDFSDWRDDIDAGKDTVKEDGKNSFKQRFFAGVPKITEKSKDKMAIYLLFIQHIIASLKKDGKAAVVVPTGFVTAQGGIEYRIREELVKKKWLKGVVSMPSNIFANTGTNVSVLFIDKANTGDVVLVEASKLGKKIKEGKNQKTVLSAKEEQRIIDAFNNREAKDDFSVVLTYKQIEDKGYSFAAGQYFEVKIEFVPLTAAEFNGKIAGYQKELADFATASKRLDGEIAEQLKILRLSGGGVK
jgi:type I restriction enzyme M protein